MRFLQQLGNAFRYATSRELSTTEAAGIAHAIAGIAPSFDRSLLPRTTPQQAGLTGLWSAMNYGITATTQAFIEATARKMGADRLATPQQRRVAIMAADATAVAVGLGVRRAVPRVQDGPIVRASVRAGSWRLAMSGISGLAALSADGLADLLTRRHTERNVNALMTLAAGVAVTGGMYLVRTRRLIDTGVEHDQFGDSVAENVKVQPVRAVAVGVGVSSGLYLLSRGERLVAHGVGAAIVRAIPSAAPYSHALGHLAAFGALALAVERALVVVYGQTEQAGFAVERAYDDRPDSPYVSGGPKSGEDWSTFGREGRRYINMALTADDIEFITGKPAMNPIRAFVGLESDVSPNARAFRAMVELERLGAFDRSAIAVFFPTGTGYVNYVAAESLEYFTAGDVASVAIQYSVRPSFLSLDRVGAAWESNLALLTALAWKLRSLPEGKRPRVLLFGESLGSLGGQDVFRREGTRGFDLLEVDRALFIGTPFFSKWRQEWLRDPKDVDPTGIVAEVQGIEDWDALPEEQRERTRIVLLTHNQDPIPKFGAPLIVQEPAWMGPPENRPPGIPRETVFLPILTFLQVAVDMLNSEHVRPGTFESYGHDYRADLAQMVRVAYDLEVDPEVMERVEKALRQRELEWAERRLTSETLEAAEKQVRATMAGWGLDTGSVPNLVIPKRQVKLDPYAVEPTAPENPAKAS